MDQIMPQITNVTFKNGIGQVSHIDHVVVKKGKTTQIINVKIILSKSEEEHIKNCMSLEEINRLNQIVWDPVNTSDHRAILLEMDVGIEMTKLKPFAKPTSINWEKDSDIEIYVRELEKELNRTDLLEKIEEKKGTTELNEIIDNLTTTIRKAKTNKLKALENIKENTLKGTKKKPWWNTELEALKRRRIDVHERLVKSGGAMMHKVQLRIIRTQFKKLERKAKAAFEYTRRKQLVEKFYDNKNLYWKEIEKRQKKSQSVEVSKEELIDYYSKLFNEPPPNSNPLTQNEKDEKLAKIVEKFKGKTGDHKVVGDIIHKILGKLKNGKRAGYNGIENELFKYGRGTKLTKVVTKLLQAYINGGKILESLNIGLLCPILKDENGSNTDKENTRPITISETLAGIYERYVLERILLVNKIHDNQCGFKNNSSTNHAIYVMRELMRTSKEKKQNLYLTVYDYSKAFDKVERTRLMLGMVDKMEAFEWLALYNYYKGSKIIIFTKKIGYTTKIKITRGVKQGGSLSPLLFNFYVQLLILRVLDSSLTIQIVDLRLGIILYADDTATMCKTANELKKVLKIIEEFCKENEIIINVKKTFWLKTG